MFVFIQGFLGILIGFYLSKKGKKIIDKNSVENLGLKLSNYTRYMFLFFGTAVAWLALDVDFSIYDITKDIVVNILGFTGLIFTFLIGNFIKNKSDLEKSIIELQVAQAIQKRNTGYDNIIYEEKINEIRALIEKNNMYIKKILVKGISSILFYIICIIGLIYYPIVNRGLWV